MCGIVGYIGNRQALPILINGLKKLEYRGYDSAGCAIVSPVNHLETYKAKGKVANLEEKIKAGKTDGQYTLGIAHTRWATHGIPSETNAHPHISQSGNIALVHNGIIENYAALKDMLTQKGYTFKSETDTEVLVQLIEDSMPENGNLTEGVHNALRQCTGAYAIAVIDRRNPDTMVVARKASPLAIGITEDNGEFFIASDASPIAGYTRKIIYLKDEEIATIVKGRQPQVENLYTGPAEYEIKEVDLDLSMLDKGGFPHFMLKEIFDQPKVLKNCMAGRIRETGEKYEVILSAVEKHRETLSRTRRITIVSCGTSLHAGMIGKQLLEHFCRIHTEVAYASEYRYNDTIVEPGETVIAISQSGETADTLAAIEKAKENGATVFGIVNSVGSSIARQSDTGTYIHIGPEIGVASTKAFTGQVTVLVMLALALGKVRGTADPQEYNEVLAEMTRIPEKIQKILQQNDKIKDIARTFTYARNCLYLGRGWNYPVALEGALKLKEISYIHAEGYPAAEMKHGPIALIDEEMPVIFIATQDNLYRKTISNMQEVLSRKGRIFAVTTEGDEQAQKMCEATMEIPQTMDCLTPILSVIPLQLLSYHIAVARQLNVDQPRNLAKSVTVE